MPARMAAGRKRRVESSGPHQAAGETGSQHRPSGDTACALDLVRTVFCHVDSLGRRKMWPRRPDGLPGRGMCLSVSHWTASA